MLLGLIVLGTVLSTSCSKESEVTPEKKEVLPHTIQYGPKKNLGDYD
ncbi:hypothetical protein [Pseudopedobacter beijingensis]|uniref:Uncharacterized protein n=1 Tax=Pseudopedobacter beijingensis TaxID=1207056 RepID=A0ABW4IHW2_9SPHI